MKFRLKWDKTKLVSHLGEKKREEEEERIREEVEEEEEEEERYENYLSMKLLYGWLCFCVWNLYGSVCMDISGSISRV